MEYIEISAKTVDEAITEALVKLGTTSDRIEYEIVEKGNNGFLGIGRKDAVIKVRKKYSVNDDIKDFLNKVFEAMDLKVEIVMTAEENSNVINVDLKGDDMGVLIGKRGQTLDSLQYLTNLAVNKNAESFVKVKIDTEDYRKRRRETLENLAKNIAYKVKRTKRPVSLEPMNPYERRVIHSTLQNDKYVETHSEGEEPYRKVVISLKPGFEKEYDKKKKYGYGNKSRYRNNGGYKKYNNSYRKNYNRYDENKDVVLDETKNATDGE